MGWFGLGSKPQNSVQVKLKKQKLRVIKRLITAREQVIRADYTDHIRRQGSKVRGGGTGRPA